MQDVAKENSGEITKAGETAVSGKHETDVLMRRDSLDAQEAATPNELRELLFEVAGNAREAHARALECHDIFVDMVANGEEPDAVVKARDDMLRSLETAQKCNDSMLKAVRLMLESRKKDDGPAGVVQKGQIQNNFIFHGEHRAINDALKRRRGEDA